MSPVCNNVILTSMRLYFSNLKCDITLTLFYDMFKRLNKLYSLNLATSQIEFYANVICNIIT